MLANVEIREVIAPKFERYLVSSCLYFWIRVSETPAKIRFEMTRPESGWTPVFVRSQRKLILKSYKSSSCTGQPRPRSYDSPLHE